MHNATVLILLINDDLYSVFLMLENEYIPIGMVNPNTITVMHPVLGCLCSPCTADGILIGILSSFSIHVYKKNIYTT